MESLIQQAVKPELIVLIPILNGIGAILKSTPCIKNWAIPYILIAVGMALAVVYMFFAASDSSVSTGMIALSGVIQGFLCALSAVGGHQSVKQIAEKNGE